VILSEGNGTVTEPRMYQLIRQVTPIADRQFEIDFPILVSKCFRSPSADEWAEQFSRVTVGHA
jgi:hypothetical protein